MDFKGIIIEESLIDTSVLRDLKIILTKKEIVTEKHKTPWVKQWTMYDVEIEEGQASVIAEKISVALDNNHNWYADYKNDREHYIIYPSKVFYITDRSDESQYEIATKYGISIGIPDYQVDFSSHVAQWKR